MKHGLRALRDCLPNEVELSTKNVSIAIVGKDKDFTIYDDDDVAPFVSFFGPCPLKKIGLFFFNPRTRSFWVEIRFGVW